MVIDEYKREISTTIDILKNIQGLCISAINVYGSANNEDLFIKGSSDIDIIAICNNFKDLDLQLIVDQLMRLNLDFKEKRPIILEDKLCKRIEFYLKFHNIAIDMTICSGLIPSYESLIKDVCYDNFEALMGGIYINSTSVYGKIPDYDIFKKYFMPFYSEEIRKKRLDILANRILVNNERINNYLITKDCNICDYIFKIRKSFIQFLYIYYRKYYLSPEKHTYYQLTKLLHLNEDEKRALCFLDGDIFECARKYLNVSNKYIQEYKKEKEEFVRRRVINEY